ncbi:MAG: OmpH family outer membrane protein [Planctomycetota bacterium]
MKKRHLVAISAALVLSAGITWSLASAQAPAGAVPSRGTVALVDVTFIFENLPSFKASMEEMKADVKKAEEEVRGLQKEIADMIQQAQTVRDSNPREFKRLEEEITRKRADLAIRIEQQKRDLVQREATIHLSTYRVVQQHIDYFCKTRGIDLVLRFNGEDAKAERPDSVLAYINRPVVWYAADRDITPYILQSLGVQVGATPTADHRNVGPFTTNR